MLSGLVSWIIQAILNWLWGKGAAAAALAAKDKHDHETAVNQAAQDSKPAEELKPDASSSETDSAIDSELRHL